MDFLSILFNNKKEKKLQEFIKNGALLIDVRSSDEFTAGSAPGAINIPLDKIQDELSKLNDAQNIIVFCKSGMRSG